MENTINADLKAALERLAVEGVVPGEMIFTRQVISLGAKVAYTVRAVEDSGIIILSTTTATAIQLPPAADCPGQEVTLINIAADAAASCAFVPDGTETIKGSAVGATDAACVQSSGAASATWANPDTTNLNGDRSTIVSDGVDNWYIKESVGVWASV